ncbi:MAG: benzoate/H(+) symporter BenE family transporter [Alphaproteobacteria bacterium]
MRGPSLQATTTGFLAGLVGFSSSFAILLQGFTAVGASQAEAASGLMAASIAMGVGGVYLSLTTRLPISVAWSTPGAALLVTTPALPGGFPEAVGAFVLAGLMIVLTGCWARLGRLVGSIPPAIANAMLAGVLLGLCLAPMRAIGQAPLLGLAIAATWAVTGIFSRLFAVPAAVATAMALIAWTTPVPEIGLATLPQPVFVMPSFSMSGAIGIALPLYLVTMASQNIPGMAVLNANGYHPAPGPLLRATGILGTLAAPFGSHAVNLAAITAALCAGPEAHADPTRRYWAAAASGIAYIAFGLAAGAVTAFIVASPAFLIEAVAGLALFGALGAALGAALSKVEHREEAVVTFIVTASGLSAFGIGGAFWGLVAGGAMLGMKRLRSGTH